MEGVSSNYDAIARFIKDLKTIDCVTDAFVVNIDEEEATLTTGDEGTASVVGSSFTFTITAQFVSTDQEADTTEETSDGQLEETVEE